MKRQAPYRLIHKDSFLSTWQILFFFAICAQIYILTRPRSGTLEKVRRLKQSGVLCSDDKGGADSVENSRQERQLEQKLKQKSGSVEHIKGAASERGTGSVTLNDNILGTRAIRKDQHVVGAEQVDDLEKRATFLSGCNLEKIGGRAKDNYGAWTLCGNGLRPAGIVYSFGIGNDLSFDNALVDRGLQVYGFDPTVTPEKVRQLFEVNHNREQPEEFHYKQLGLGAADGVVTFLRSRNTKIQSMTALSEEQITANYKDIGFQAAVLRLKTFMCMHGHTWLDVLKMDVEGVEMAVCTSKDFTSLSIPADQVLIEFHERMMKNGNQLKAACIQNLQSKGFQLVHTSPNKQELAFARMSSKAVAK